MTQQMRVRGWREFQHYTHRNPPWVRLHKRLLDNPDWHALDGESAKALIMIWLVASEDKQLEGYLPDSKALAFRLRISESKMKAILCKLTQWVEHDASMTLADGLHDADTDKIRLDEIREDSDREDASQAKPPSPKGSRLNLEWELQSEMGQWAETQGMTRKEILEEADKFKDYWMAQPGAKGVKLDWDATWRNWIRNRNKFQGVA